MSCWSIITTKSLRSFARRTTSAKPWPANPSTSASCCSIIIGATTCSTSARLCCNYYNTKNTSIDTRRWHQRQPAYVWGYPDSCLQEAAEQGLLKPDYPPDHYGEVVVTIMKGIAFDWCLSGAAFDMHERLDEIMVPYLKSIQTAPPETTGA